MIALGWNTARVSEIQQLFAACEGARFGQLNAPTEKLPSTEQALWRGRLHQLVQWMRDCERTS